MLEQRAVIGHGHLSGKLPLKQRLQHLLLGGLHIGNHRADLGNRGNQRKTLKVVTQPVQALSVSVGDLVLGITCIKTQPNRRLQLGAGIGNQFENRLAVGINGIDKGLPLFF